jgi:hypothetical protein
MIAHRAREGAGRPARSTPNALPATVLSILALSYACVGWTALARPDWLAFGGSQAALLWGPAALLLWGSAMLPLYFACSGAIVCLALLGAWKAALRVPAVLGVLGVWIGAALFALAMSI